MNKVFVQYPLEVSESPLPAQKQSPKAQKKKRRISWVKICILCGLGFCCFEFGKQFMKYQQIQNEIAHYEQIKQEKLMVQKELEKTKLLLDDPAYIERVAREHLGFVYEGEVLVLPSEKVSDEIPQYEADIKEGDIH